MTIQDYLRVLRERWRLILAVTAVVVLATGVAWAIRGPEYTATSTLYVSSQVADDPSSAFEGAQLSQQRVSSYIELATSRRVLDDVIQRLHLDTSPEQLAKKVSASNSLSSVVIQVKVIDSSPAQAARIANTLDTVFVGLVDEIERPIQPNARQAVTVRVVQPADVPVVASSTGMLTILGLALLGGLVVGIACGLVRDKLDTRIKSTNQLSVLAGAPNLGATLWDPSVVDHPLFVIAEGSRSGEYVRQLRTNLQYIDVDRSPKTFMFSSPMPAEGKTTTVANLGLAMAMGGLRVLLVESDLRRPRLTSIFGLENAAGLTSVISGRATLDHVIQAARPNLDLLSSGPIPPNPSELLASQNMASVIRELSGRYDQILFDAPPLLAVSDASALAPLTDGVVVIARSNKTTRDQLSAAVENLRASGAPILGTILTAVPEPAAEGRAYDAYRSEKPESSGAPFTAIHRASNGSGHGEMSRPTPRPR
ncbi:polysaccharide biosynthesis tyrosine autokinase [Actinomycetospora sp. TBRC 11914]|uniref:polysaccharide biosynthesis tyrosine autokinase n=1 Tax=Actinomycetospora sp. TBRC 11914 TaxID=2729387 RepID=UPI00145DEB64|nr:polysaccharide biosynthesis tyrosine autokinase [Actinomycetospora sp. TBRC 11914]NMO90337.1 polysaccharide biosynthesis tyrosine autokinase [Actinomycetospora sp. TBRC 11914]